MNAAAPRSLTRLLPLAGVAYAALSLAGDLVIGPFPDERTSPDQLVTYYAGHHAQVQLGGTLLSWAAVFFGFFAAACYLRIRRFSPLLGGAVLIGAAASVAADGFSGTVYATLGGIGTEHSLTPQALQAWHVWGASFGDAVGIGVFLVAVGLASTAVRAVPRWLGLSGLVLGLAQLSGVSPFGFLASLLTLLWAAIAAVVLVRRPVGSASPMPAALPV